MAADRYDNTFYNMVVEAINEVYGEEISADKMVEIIGSDEFAKLYAKVLNDESVEAVYYIENYMYGKVLENRAIDAEFMAKQNLKWGQAFIASEAMYLYVLESAREYDDYIKQEHGGEVCHIYNALRSIHGRAMQIYLEVLVLNKNGLSDGAYARWRSLYELSVISSFIKGNGESVAKRFLEAAKTEDRYEWARAAGCFQNMVKKYVTFSDIQKNCELATEEWKKEYDFVNKLVHASPQGTMFRIGSKKNNVHIVGKTDWGMTVPAIHAAISLAQITKDFYTVFHHGDSLLAMLTLHRWVAKIEEYCRATEEECFKDDDFCEYL